MNPFSQKIPPLYSLPLLKGGWGRDFVVGISVLVFFLLPFIGFAQGYVPLAPLPNTVPEPCNPLNPNALKPTDAGYKDTCKTGSLPDYLSGLYKLGIGAAGVLAVLMLVWGGFQYTTSEAIQGKSDARGIIQNVLWGGAIVLGSYLLLFTINPRLVDIGLALQNLQAVRKQQELFSTRTTYTNFLEKTALQLGKDAKKQRQQYEETSATAQAKFAEAKTAEEAGDFEKARELREDGYVLERTAETERQIAAAKNKLQIIAQSSFTEAENLKKLSPEKLTQEINRLKAQVAREANDRIAKLQEQQNASQYTGEMDAIRAESTKQQDLVEKAVRYWQCYYYTSQSAEVEKKKQECKPYQFWPDQP